MAETLPQWLANALAGAGNGAPQASLAQLAIARLANESLLGRDGFRLSSPAFDDGEELDPCFTADEEDAVAPPLEWSAPPEGAVEMALLVEDPQGGARQEPFAHWLVWGLAGQRGKLLEGETPPRVGKNSFGNSEWLPPEPADGDAPHDYIFQLFALDEPLSLMPGASRADLIAAMEGHVIGAAVLTGTYAASADAEEVDWDGDGE